MASFDLMLEAEKRGILPEDKLSMLNEARKRGLVDSGNPLQDTPYSGIVDAKRNTGIARTIADNAMQGATLGFADEATSALAAPFVASQVDDRFGNGIGDTWNAIKEAYNAGQQLSKQDLAGQMHANPATAILSNIAGGILTGAAGATTKAGAAMGNTLRSGNIGARIAKGSLAGATSGGLYGAGTADQGKRLKGAGTGILAGGVVGGAIPALSGAIKGVYSGLKNTISPTVEKETAALAKRAQEFGIPLRLDQVSPTRARNTVQKISQEIPFSGVDSFEKAQKQSFTKAVAKTIGLDTADLSPSAIQGFRGNIGKKFDTALKGTDVIISNDKIGMLPEILSEATGTIDDSLVKVVAKNVEEVTKQLGAGKISGDKLASIRSQLIKRSVNSKSSASSFINDIVDVIDSIIEDNLSAEKIKKLAEAKGEWRNFKTIQQLLEKSTDGTINPTDLLNKVSSNKYIDASKIPVGQDELVDLARIGKQFLAKKGGSDTFQKMALATGAGASVLNPITAALAATTMAGNKGYQSLINQSPALVERVVNNPSTQSALSKLLIKQSPKLMAGSVPLQGSASNNLANMLMNRR